MSEEFLRKGQEILNRLEIKTKRVKSNKDIQEAKNFSAIIVSKNKTTIK